MTVYLTTENRACILATLGLTLVLCVPLTANAQSEASAGKSAAAQALFEQARALVAQGHAEQACPKFSESQRLDPGVGTQFNLADCYERTNRLASAYALFMDVAAATRQLGQVKREALARQRADALKPRLSRLVVLVDRANVPEQYTLTRNGAPVGEAQWGVSIPVDPGTITIRAEAPGRRPWEITLDVAGEGETQSVEVHTLEPLPPNLTRDLGAGADVSHPNTSSEPSPTPFWDEPKNIAGAVLVGLGAVGLGTGGYFGLTALSQKNESEPFCINNACDATGKPIRQAAYDAGNNASIAFAAGGACLAASLVLFFVLEPSDTEVISHTVSITPVLEAGSDPFTGLVFGAML